MKILVAATSYSKPGEKDTHFFIQVRNLFYKTKGIDVTVLNFSAKEDYVISGIPVITKKSCVEKINNHDYDILVCHAPNLRNHYLFLRKYGHLFRKFVFFFHGHEVLKINKVYSEPYSYMGGKSLLKKTLQNTYDDIKLKIWNRFYQRVCYKSAFIFVSNWMYQEFLKWTKIPEDLIKKHCYITYNSIGKNFENKRYSLTSHKEYDFITIRGNLDGSKYCIDLVNKLAFQNPNLRFCVVGKGAFFKYYKKAPNLIWHNTLLNHVEIIEYLNKSRCALMPTRTDAQGLMMCEMASFGMPLITTNIPVCYEVFSGFENVYHIDLNFDNLKLDPILEDLIKKMPYSLNDKYYSKNTVAYEIDIFRTLS